MARNWHALEKRVRVAETAVGRGVFAMRKYRVNQTIGAIQGKIIDDAAYGSHYCMDLGGTRSLEPIAPFRYLNHSCDPNSEIFSWDYESKFPQLVMQLFLQAIKPIDVGEELTIDYAWTADAAIPCLCGSAKCRGWVVSEEELKLVASFSRALPTA